MDEDLLRRYQNRDKLLLRSLFDEHGPMIRGLVSRMIADQSVRQDIYQDVAKQVVSGIGGFEGRCALGTWIYRIALRVIFRYYKKDKVSDCEVRDSDFPGRTQSQLELLEKKEALVHVRTAVASLHERQREILSLFYFGQLSIEEISSCYKMNAGAVKAVLFKARKAIISQLKKKGLHGVL